MRILHSLPLGLLLMGLSPVPDAPPPTTTSAPAVNEATLARQSTEFAKIFPLILRNDQLARQLAGGATARGRDASATPAPPHDLSPREEAVRATAVRETQLALRDIEKAIRAGPPPTPDPATGRLLPPRNPRLHAALETAARSATAALDQAEFQAHTALRQIKQLADASRLYQPEPGPATGPVFALGSPVVAQDYLRREFARTAVLCAYADPYLEFLANLSAVADAGATDDRPSDYWRNTVAELRRATQQQDRDGAVGRLEALVLEVLVDLTPENCAERLAKPPASDDPAGFDLFSERHRKLLQRTRELCGGKH